jgi:hypothetical protein
MKEFLNGLRDVLLFRSGTSYERWFEIGLSIMAWLNILMIILVIVF